MLAYVFVLECVVFVHLLKRLFSLLSKSVSLGEARDSMAQYNRFGDPVQLNDDLNEEGMADAQIALHQNGTMILS